MSNDAHGEKVFPGYPVLLVDDEEHFLNSMNITLKSEGITNVEKCQDSREVIPLLKKKRYSLILLDILMPHIRGNALLPQILEEQPGVKVIMLTAVNEVETAVQCMSAGAVDYLVKPVEKSELIEKVKNNLDEGMR
jgi:DNA-binding NtrC family response regulator